MSASQAERRGFDSHRPLFPAPLGTPRCPPHIKLNRFRVRPIGHATLRSVHWPSVGLRRVSRSVNVLHVRTASFHSPTFWAGTSAPFGSRPESKSRVFQPQVAIGALTWARNCTSV